TEERAGTTNAVPPRPRGTAFVRYYVSRSDAPGGVDRADGADRGVAPRVVPLVVALEGEAEAPLPADRELGLVELVLEAEAGVDLGPVVPGGDVVERVLRIALGGVVAVGDEGGVELAEDEGVEALAVRLEEVARLDVEDEDRGRPGVVVVDVLAVGQEGEAEQRGELAEVIADPDVTDRADAGVRVGGGALEAKVGEVGLAGPAQLEAQAHRAGGVVLGLRRGGGGDDRGREGDGCKRTKHCQTSVRVHDRPLGRGHETPRS